MRINSYASAQYSRNSVVEKPQETKQTEPHANVRTTSFGFRLGKFGVDYQTSSTTIDPTLSRDVREKKQKAEAFNTEREVESLRAKVGAEGASYRDLERPSSVSGVQSRSTVRNAMNAYAKSTEQELPLPGSMLAAVV